MGIKELLESPQAKAKVLCRACEYYGQIRRIPDKLVTAKCRDEDAAMTLTKTKTPQLCWYGLHENHPHPFGCAQDRLRRGHIPLENA